MSIPFEISEIHAGFSEAKGTIRLEEEYLVIDIQTITMGIIKQSPETIKIELAALSDLRIDKRIFRDRLFIRPKTNKLLEAVPGKHLGELKLLIWRKHRTSTLGLIDDVLFHLRKKRRKESVSENYDRNE